MRRSLVFFLLAVPLFAGERWIRVTTSHFEMYTTNGEKQALRSLQGFEQVRSFFLEKSGRTQAQEKLVRIIAFSSEREYKPFRLNEGAFAYYMQSHERDYIVMQDIAAEHSQAAVHEYTHLIVRHQKLEYPLWFNEGIADVYSSLEPRGDQALVGRPLDGHLMVLSTKGFMDWNMLFAVNQDSPYYNKSDKMQLFYAQSWAMTHMLTLGDHYMQGFGKFAHAISSGVSTPDALQQVYGKTVEQVGKDVQAYLRQTTMKAALYNVKLAKQDLEPKVEDVSGFQADLALADILSCRPQTAEEARRRLLELEKQYPNNVELEESLGYLNWQQNNMPETMKHFGGAVEHGSKNAEMMLQYAELLENQHGSYDAVSGVVQKVLSMDEGNKEARIFLAGVQLNERQYSMALETLAPIHTVTPALAYRFFSVSALVHANLRDFEGGRTNAETALKYAESGGQREEMGNLLEYIRSEKDRKAVLVPALVDSAASHDGIEEMGEHRPTLKRQVEPELPRVKGTLKSFECLSGGGYRLHVSSESKEMVFVLPAPEKLLVRNQDGAISVEWSCGVLKPQSVTVVYRAESQKASVGVVTELIF